MKLTDHIDKESLKTDVPEFSPGDSVKVHVRVVGVERTFPVHSPIIEKIEVVSQGDVRRAKLYYQRERIGKRAKIKEKRY